MKTLLLLCSLIFSTFAFADVTPTKQIEISQDKGVDYHNYYFGMVRVNNRAYVNYYVTNTGSIPLFFQGSMISGPGFYARHSCGGVLYPRAQCTFTIEYAPFFEGYHSGQFRMGFDQGYEIVVQLSGQGMRY